MAEYRDELLDHDYDGIQELDNDLPRWWLWGFYFSIVFAFFYLMYFHVLGIGYSSIDQYKSEMNPNYVRATSLSDSYFGLVPRYRSPLAQRHSDINKPSAGPVMVRLTRDTDTTTYVANMEAGAIATGHDIFMTNCASCHGNEGQGGVGPNLTDNYWIHGAEFTNIVKTVRYGYPTKGMIAWLGQLSPEQIIEVSSFVTTLHGTNPPNPKAPEGELVTQ